MRSALRTALQADAQRRAGRDRSNSLSTVPPATDSDDYVPELAAIAATILYRSPLPSSEGRPVYVLNSAAFPDAFEVDYDSLLSYVLARLPGEDELLSGTEYEIVFFAGGPLDSATAEKKQGPATGWYLQAYHVLGRALRKKLAMLYIVHPRTWVRVLLNVFGTVVSPKFRRKILHVNCLTQLAVHIPIEKLLIPPSAYLQDRKYSPDIFSPFVTGRRAFGVKHPLPKNITTGKTRLPRVLRETTTFLLEPSNLKTEGIFRIPPHSTLTSILKEAYDRGQQWIVWKETDASYSQPGLDKSTIDEIRSEDTYGVHLAASMIKTWYRELREPIFHESSYAMLRERYNDPDVQVTPEDLVDIMLDSSPVSPLSATAREILTRHLLPLLSVVALHEPDNKMTAENLAICFSMCLVRGTDQMADAKVSTIVKRILQAAIAMWPQLRTGLGLDESSFYADLQAPDDPKEYEDPLEQLCRPSSYSEDDPKSQIGHRISMNDSDGSDASNEQPPALPPRRRSRAQSFKAALAPHIPNVELPRLPKRKPAPYREPSPGPAVAQQHTTDVTTMGEPPRYSSIFDREGRHLSRPESPGSFVQVPADGFAPPKRSDSSFDMMEEVKQQKPRRRPVSGAPAEAIPSGPASAEGIGRTLPGSLADVPKRKPVSRQTSVKGENSQRDGAVLQNCSQSTSTSTSTITPDSMPSRPMPSMPAGTNAVLAEMAARQAANNLVQNNVTDTEAVSVNSNTVTPVPHSTPADLAVKMPQSTTSTPVVEGPFRKPSWPASAKQQGPGIQSLAKPILPTRTLNTIVSAVSGLDGTGGPAPGVPKPRAPSAGLLNRMSSWENRGNPDSSPSQSSAMLEPSKLNLKKSSVDDLRRLYEERATTASTLVQIGRSSSSNQ